MPKDRSCEIRVHLEHSVVHFYVQYPEHVYHQKEQVQCS